MTKHDPDRGADIVAAISEYRHAHGYGPTVRDLGPLVGLASTAAVQYHLNRLVADGILSRTAGLTRTLRVVDEEVTA